MNLETLSKANKIQNQIDRLERLQLWEGQISPDGTVRIVPDQVRDAIDFLPEIPTAFWEQAHITLWAVKKERLAKLQAELESL